METISMEDVFDLVAAGFNVEIRAGGVVAILTDEEVAEKILGK